MSDPAPTYYADLAAIRARGERPLGGVVVTDTWRLVQNAERFIDAEKAMRRVWRIERELRRPERVTERNRLSRAQLAAERLEVNAEA